MPEERGIYMKEKVFEQLVYFGMLHRMTKADASAAARRWLEPAWHHRIRGLLRGKAVEGQPAEGAAHRDAAARPRADYTGRTLFRLDPVNTELFRSVIRELVEEGRYIVMSSHQMATVEEYCENLLILNRGKTILKGNLREIKSGYGASRLAVNTSPRNRRGRSRAGTGAGGNPRRLHRYK